MGTNSIIDNLDKKTMISTIKLLLSNDIDKKDIFIVVEGDDDVKFIKKFLNNTVKIVKSYSGKAGVEEIVNSKVIDSDRVIGIRDRDYYQGSVSEKIFFYDRCCLEMMMAEFDEVFEGIYHEFYNGEMKPQMLKKHILDELNIVSQLRKYNEINYKGINFEGISFRNIVDDDYKIVEDKFIEIIEKLNSGKGFDFIDIIKVTRGNDVSDLLDITNGHDFIILFKTICDIINNRKSVKNRKIKLVKDREISSVLRASFSGDYLKKTNLYKDIKGYFYNEYDVWDLNPSNHKA